MATVSERARELAKELEMVTYPHSEHVLDKLEQALLAERRLAMEDAAKIAEDTLTEFDAPLCVSKRAGDRTRLIAGRLRAAAEKEVGTK